VSALTVPKSAELEQRALRLFPGGINSNNYLIPTIEGPLFIERADGSRLVDVDGNTYVDFWPSHSALLVGHNHPDMRAAIEEQLSHGSNFGLATSVQLDLADELQRRFPSMERMVFADSNTRANSYAVRLARAFTGRHLYAKIQGAYHGTVDTFFVGVQKVYDEPVGELVARPGIPRGVVDDVVLIQWNDAAQAQEVFDGHGDELAAVLIEPVLGDGIIPPAPGFLEALRKGCDEHGALLIYDEAVTCGMSPGGAQQYFGIHPDLSVVGKGVGGGLPFAAVGGREEIMQLTDPRNGMPQVPISMTFAGHPLACAAAIAQLKLLTDDTYDHMSGLATKIAAGVTAIAGEYEVPLSATTAQHLFYLHWHDGPVENWYDHRECDDEILARIQGLMLENGIYIGSKGRSCICAAHTDKDVGLYLDALRAAVDCVTS
jgi:glutamate-1-semialdehyde 2,1-aminomutase